MFMIHNTVHENGIEYLDVKTYESLSRDENALLTHTRIYQDTSTGRMTHETLFRRSDELVLPPVH